MKASSFVISPALVQIQYNSIMSLLLLLRLLHWSDYRTPTSTHPRPALCTAGMRGATERRGGPRGPPLNSKIEIEAGGLSPSPLYPPLPPPPPPPFDEVFMSYHFRSV